MPEQAIASNVRSRREALPREVAPAHRHVQSALRFIVDGQGAYTTVNGERTTKFPGDFIITPSWAWHAIVGVARLRQ
jgi:gentisate 1,2-dioxygenase